MKSNSNGNLLIDFSRQTGLRIANGRVGSDAGIGECTYVGSSGTSLIDYVLVSEKLLKYFVTFDVFDPNPISDHCLIEFSLDLRRIDLTKNEQTMNENNKVKSSYKLKKCKCKAYKEIHGLITHLLNQDKKLYCAFVDFKKAFDFVNRDIIWYKLIKLGVRGKMLNVIRSMYNSVKSKVKYNNDLSSNCDSYRREAGRVSFAVSILNVFE